MTARDPVIRAACVRPLLTCPNFPGAAAGGPVQCGIGMFSTARSPRDDPAVPGRVVLAAIDSAGEGPQLRIAPDRQRPGRLLDGVGRPDPARLSPGRAVRPDRRAHRAGPDRDRAGRRDLAAGRPRRRGLPAIVWLGIVGLLCLVPSIAGMVDQLTAFGSQTLLPSIEAAYPWLVALLATSLFSGFGIARRLQGGTAIRRRRLLAGSAIALVATGLSGAAFGAAAVVNDTALRDQPTVSSRFGPTVGSAQPPLCGMPLTTGTTARLTLHLGRHGRPALDRFGGRFGRPGQRRFPLAGVRRHEPRARRVRLRPDRPAGMDPHAVHRLALGPARYGQRRHARRPGPGRGTQRRLPGDRRGPRRGGHRRRPGPALPGCRRRADLRSGLPAGPPGWSARPTSIAGGASSTTGSSSMARSARSPAASMARRPAWCPRPSRGRSRFA